MHVDYELIIVDDGSDDGTESIAKMHADSLTYLYQQNKGVSSARNNGTEARTGQIYSLS